MFTAALSTIAKATQVPHDRGMDKPNGVHIGSGIVFGPEKERNSDTGCNMDIEDVMLNDKSQTQEEEYCMISLICGT